MSDKFTQAQLEQAFDQMRDERLAEAELARRAAEHVSGLCEGLLVYPEATHQAKVMFPTVGPYRLPYTLVIEIDPRDKPCKWLQDQKGTYFTVNLSGVKGFPQNAQYPCVIHKVKAGDEGNR